jgi:3-oxoacyl-[acyl-carrier protein] reductase
MSTPYDFSGKVALVTGSSRGIGAGIITALGQGGAKCIVNYVTDPEGRNKADADKIASALNQSVVIQCDVGDPGQVSAMMAQIQKEFGGLDILVNNAGILRDRTIKKMSMEEWETVLRVNLTGAFNCIQHAQPLLRPQGRVVNISSVAAQVGFLGSANYAASKAGLIALTKVTARELARHQITANAVAPGFINTEIHKGLSEEIAKNFIAQIPAGRFGDVEDIAAAVLFLCSPQARYITGQVLHVNGGFHM